MANYGRELKMRADIRRKEKVEKAIEFVERIIKNTRGIRGSIEESIRKDEKTKRIDRWKDLENMWKVKLNPNIEEFRRSELLGKYIAEILFGWYNRKLKDEYLKKVREKLTKMEVSFSKGKILKRE